MTVGVPDEDHGVKPRLPIAAILHENGYDEKYDELLNEYDETMSAYYKERSSNQKRNMDGIDEFIYV